MKKLALSGLMALGVLVALHYAVAGLFRGAFGSADEPTVTFQPTPNGALRTAVITFSGGGAISPYCHTALAIVPARASAKEAADEAFQVFSGGCDGFAPKGGTAASSPTIEWLSATSLRVSFFINSTATRSAVVRLKKRDASGAVNVEFVADE